VTHVMVRGIEWRRLFETTTDRQDVETRDIAKYVKVRMIAGGGGTVLNLEASGSVGGTGVG
jgi:hypothetical protein